jgi:RimJ/RimL family protein N-acetyltransferase
MKIVLAPFEETDSQRLLGWIVSKDFLFQWAGPTFRYPLDEAQIKQYLQESQYIENGTMHFTSKNFKAMESQTNRVVGHIALAYINEDHQRAMLDQVLIGHPEDRGKGYGAQMVQETLRVGFETLNLHSISLTVPTFNTAAIKCYEKVGLTHEGTMRDVFRVGNTFWSYHLMSILEDEWKERQRR